MDLTTFTTRARLKASAFLALLLLVLAAGVLPATAQRLAITTTFPCVVDQGGTLVVGTCTGFTPDGSPSPTASATATQPPSPTVTPTQPPPAISSYDHVVILMMENHDYSQIIGSSSAPYINGTLVKDGLLETNYDAVAHPSLPNYMALTAGQTYSNADCTVAQCPHTDNMIAKTVLAAGKSWKAYEESMPANCYPTDSGSYNADHNPFAYFSNLPSCATNDVPYTQLSGDFASAATTPSYSFVVPNVNDNMHSGTIAQGDTWLSQQVPLILGSPAFTTQHSLLVVVWDENLSYTTPNKVAAILLGSGITPGTTDGTAYTHYSLLHTVECALGLPTLTTNDATAAAMLPGVCGGAGGTPTPSPSPSPTGTPPLSPTGWKTMLDDEFTSAGIPSHWGLYNGHYGSGPSNNCAAPSQDSAPGDGYLYLTMSYQQSGPCGADWYEGGMQVSSAFDFPQQAVTVRWRVQPSAAPSVVYAHYVVPMLWPSDPSYQWYQAEADLCEGSALGGCTTYLHDGVSSQISHGYTVDLTQWHTWRFEQENNTLKVYLDNMSVPIWLYAGTSATLPNAMRRAVLQQECRSSGCPASSYAGNVERIQIDYVTIQVPA